MLIFGLVLFFTLFACLIVHKRDLSGIGQMFKIFPIDFFIALDISQEDFSSEFLQINKELVHVLGG